MSDLSDLSGLSGSAISYCKASDGHGFSGLRLVRARVLGGHFYRGAGDRLGLRLERVTPTVLSSLFKRAINELGFLF